MERICIGCGNPIPSGRLKALPKTQTCTGCSNTDKVVGFQLITGKTEYADLLITDKKTAEDLNKKQDRFGYGVSEGVKFDSDK